MEGNFWNTTPRAMERKRDRFKGWVEEYADWVAFCSLSLSVYWALHSWRQGSIFLHILLFSSSRISSAVTQPFHLFSLSSFNCACSHGQDEVPWLFRRSRQLCVALYPCWAYQLVNYPATWGSRRVGRGLWEESAGLAVGCNSTQVVLILSCDWCGVMIRATMK